MISSSVSIQIFHRASYVPGAESENFTDPILPGQNHVLEFGEDAMYFKEDQGLTNFRNYENQKVDFHDRVNIILGENAQGKTNLLEALYIMSLGKSFRTAKGQRNDTLWQSDGQSKNSVREGRRGSDYRNRSDQK